MDDWRPVLRGVAVGVVFFTPFADADGQMA